MLSVLIDRFVVGFVGILSVCRLRFLSSWISLKKVGDLIVIVLLGCVIVCSVRFIVLMLLFVDIMLFGVSVIL